MSSRYKQTNDYNCGPAALAYLLDISGYPVWDVDFLTTVLRSNSSEGTSPGQIVDFLQRHRITHIAGQLWHLRTPMLVNYYKEDDGHYAVITHFKCSMVGPSITYFDPEDGELHTKPWKRFEKDWYSTRYGERWGLYLREK